MDTEFVDIEFIGPKERFEPGKELFLPIRESNAYLVGNLGSVYSFKSNKYLKQRHNNRGGYMIVDLRINRTTRTFQVHRLVAEAWLPNPENLSEVNHKNEIKTDNRVENLEWVSHEDNINYGTRNQRQSQSMKAKRWYNNGTCEKRFAETDEIPDGFVRGRLKRKKETM